MTLLVTDAKTGMPVVTQSALSIPNGAKNTYESSVKYEA